MDGVNQWTTALTLSGLRCCCCCCWWVPKCRWSMACNLSHCLAHNNAISVVFPFLDHKSWLFFSRVISWLSFLFFPPSCSSSSSTSQCGYYILPILYNFFFLFSLISPESPPLLQHISLLTSPNSTRLISREPESRRDDMMRCCIQTNYRWWYWSHTK